MILLLCLQMTLAKNDAGDHFPLLAIYLGFELPRMIISEVFSTFLLLLFVEIFFHDNVTFLIATVGQNYF